LRQICIRVHDDGTIGYVSGCFYGGSPLYYETMTYGESYQIKNLVSMVRLVGDPYGIAYNLSNDGRHYLDIFEESTIEAVGRTLGFGFCIILIIALFIFVFMKVHFEGMMIFEDIWLKGSTGESRANEDEFALGTL
jgi:hypothetical protein